MACKVFIEMHETVVNSLNSYEVDSVFILTHVHAVVYTLSSLTNQIQIM